MQSRLEAFARGVKVVSKSLLRWRWWFVALMTLTVVVVEWREHWPIRPYDWNIDLMSEILLFGVVLPLTGGVVLEVLARAQRKRRHPIATPVWKAKKGEATGARRVLIVECESVLGVGVNSLLAGEADLEVIGIPPVGQAELMQKIRQSQPDVVILEETPPIALQGFLCHYPELRVVVVSPSSNLVRCYHKQQVLLTQATDLIHIIRGIW